MGNPMYASNSKANTGVTLGAVGLGLGVLNTLNNGGLGLFNGLLGNRTGVAAGAELQYVSSLQAENAMLRSENYADKVAKETYSQAVADNRGLRDEMYAFIKPLAEEAANNRVNIAVLQEQQKCSQEKADLREQIVVGKINELALTTKGRFESLDNTIACLAGDVARNTARINNITKEVIPLDALCPEAMPRYNSWVAPTTTTPSA